MEITIAIWLAVLAYTTFTIGTHLSGIVRQLRRIADHLESEACDEGGEIPSDDVA